MKSFIDVYCTSNVNMSILAAVDMKARRISSDVTRVTFDADVLPVALRAIEHVWGRTARISIDHGAVQSVADALPRRMRKKTKERRKRAAASAAPLSDFTARDVDGNVVTLDAPTTIPKVPYRLMKQIVVGDPTADLYNKLVVVYGYAAVTIRDDGCYVDFGDVPELRSRYGVGFVEHDLDAVPQTFSFENWCGYFA